MNGLDDVSIALQNIWEETDKTKQVSLFDDFQAAVASKLDLHVFHTLTSHELMNEWNRNSNASFASLEETVAGLHALIAMLDGQIGIQGGSKVNVDPLPPTVGGSLSGLNEKVADAFATLEAVGDSVLAL